MTERPSTHQVVDHDEGDGGSPSLPHAPEPSHAERCRTLVAAETRGSLSTLTVDPAGYPYGSVASYALDDAGNPLFFISLMAEHTQNVLVDARASLLVAEPVPHGEDPLARGRVTLLGRMVRLDDDDRDAARDAYLAANPSAAYYIDFGDFAFFRLGVEHLRYVGGYGRMSWVDAASYAAADADPLAGSIAAGIIEHMNADHREAQLLFCTQLLGLADVTAASMTAVDRYGFDMVAERPSGRLAVRLGFPVPCAEGTAVRRAMVDLVADARARRTT
jgi:putative heme iron utilization protein